VDHHLVMVLIGEVDQSAPVQLETYVRIQLMSDDDDTVCLFIVKIQI
jgi:hypothetical protein